MSRKLGTRVQPPRASVSMRGSEMVVHMRARTAAELIITAAHLKYEEKEFSEWDLSVAAHEKYPDRFSMVGYPKYPDHKRVYAELVKLSQDSSLNNRFWLKRVRPSFFRLTQAGLDHVYAMNKSTEDNPLHPFNGVETRNLLTKKNRSTKKLEVSDYAERLLASGMFRRWKETMGELSTLDNYILTIESDDDNYSAVTERLRNEITQLPGDMIVRFGELYDFLNACQLVLFPQENSDALLPKPEQDSDPR